MFTSSLVKLGDLRLPLTLALVPIPCFGVEIFRNPDNVRVRFVDSFRFGNVCTRIRICVSYFSRFYYPVFEQFGKKFLFSEGMILDECININFAFFFLFRLDLKGKGWKLFDYTRFYSRCFFLSFFILFLRGIIKEKKDCLCKAAHHLFIPSAHVTFRDNTWYRACLNLRISRVYRSAWANNRRFYFNISATFLRAAVSSIESPRPTVTNFFDRTNILHTSLYPILPARKKRKGKRENLQKRYSKRQFPVKSSGARIQYPP